MTNKKPLPEIQPRTIGDLSFLYKMQIRTFMTLVDANKELKLEIEQYTAKVNRKASKILPPIIISKIIFMLGEP